MKRLIGIYGICINNKWYIGSSINIKSRIHGHCSALKNNRHKVSELQKDFNNNDKCNIKILEIVEDEKYLNDLENYYIGLYNSFKTGYNKSLASRDSFGNHYLFVEGSNEDYSSYDVQLTHKGVVVAEVRKVGKDENKN